jgi:hypothetical protein
VRYELSFYIPEDDILYDLGQRWLCPSVPTTPIDHACCKRVKILNEVNAKPEVSWDIVMCILVEIIGFAGKLCFHLQDWKLNSK